MMNIKVNTYTAMKWMILSVFLFGYTIRVSTMPKLQFVSVLFFLGLFILYKKYSCCISKKKILLWGTFLISTFVSDVINNVSLHQWGMYFFINTVSLLALTIHSAALSLSKNEIKKLIKIYNGFVYLIFAIYLVDLLTGSLIMKTLAKHWLTCLANWIPKTEPLFRSRYASYLGHYLFTDVIYVGYFILNAFYQKSFPDGTENPAIFYLVTVIGVLSTGSKTGLLLMAVLMLAFNIKKIKYLFTLIVGVFALYFFGFFDIILTRLRTEDFSAGRFGAWQTLLDMKVLKVHLLYGIGDDFFEYIHQYVDFGTAGIATEFPVLCLLYKVGVVGVFAYISLMLLLPVYELLHKRNLCGALCIAVYFALLAAYNGLIVYPDTQIVYTVVVLLVLCMNKVSPKNICRLNGRKK